MNQLIRWSMSVEPETNAHRTYWHAVALLPIPLTLRHIWRPPTSRRWCWLFPVRHLRWWQSSMFIIFPVFLWQVCFNIMTVHHRPLMPCMSSGACSGGAWRRHQLAMRWKRSLRPWIVLILTGCHSLIRHFFERTDREMIFMKEKLLLISRMILVQPFWNWSKLDLYRAEK